MFANDGNPGACSTNGADSKVDPLITVIAWHGPLSQLSARLGLTPRRIRSIALRRRGRLELEVVSPAAMQTLRRQITRPEPD